MAEPTPRNSQAIDPALPEKKRGRRRLIGAFALFAGAAVILSIVFDHEPKPASPDLQLKIPARDKSVTAPVAAPAEAPSASNPAPAVVTAAPSVDAAVLKDAPKPDVPKEEPVKSGALAAPAVAAVDLPKAAPQKPEKVAPEKAVPKAVKSEDDPIAKLTEQSSAGNKPGSSGRFMVQIGAFTSEEKLEAARAKAKAAGFKTITEPVTTAGGERTRLRVGPFPDRAAAAAARDKLKTEGLEPALIAL